MMRVALLLTLLLPVSLHASETPPLPEKYRLWLEEVAVLMTDEERAAFLAVTQDYQRAAFIDRFWQVRDTNSKTPRNELREAWPSRVAEARERFGDLEEARARILLLNGLPDQVVKSDCPMVLWPMEAWFYARSEQTYSELAVILYRKWNAGPYRLWNPQEGIEVFFADGAASIDQPEGADRGPGGTQSNISSMPSRSILACDEERGRKILAAIGWTLEQGFRWHLMEQRIGYHAPSPGGEWVATFGSYSTDVPAGAPALNARLEIEYPGRMQSRTVLQGILSVPLAEAGQAQLAGHRSHNFLVTGEVVREGELFDSFRYRFDFPGVQPAGPPGPLGPAETIPLVFQRPLRPGEYTLVVKLEDLNAGRFFRAERAVSVPQVDESMPPPPPADPESARLLAEARAALASGESVLQLLEPPGELQAGMNRFDTLASPDVASVTFSLEGRPVLTKRKPPFSVELDLGDLPRPRHLSAVAFDAAGKEIAHDELLVNASYNRFRIRFLEPRQGQRYESSLQARAEVDVPDGETLERVELFLDDTRVATLYQPPFSHPVILPRDQPLAYVRAVAYLTDGNSTEDLVFVNAPDDMARIDVDFVELYTLVSAGGDRQGRPVQGLTARDFTVSEDGVRQEIARFERVTDLPIHAAVALDVSASMEPHLEQARNAALTFLEGSLRPKDRAALITFNDHPNLAVKFTKDVGHLAGGLAGLKAERGTALYDTIIFSLFYFNGVKGQRALLLLSDGKDEGSRFGWEEALDYARRAGVTIYTLGLGEELDKPKLKKLAEETGGRSFFLKDASELAAIYAAIDEELRSKYLIAYQSTNTTGSDGFREVDLKVSRPGVEVKTMRGYFP